MIFPKQIDTIDTHTEGEPTRIITSWTEEIPGSNTAEKLLYFQEHFDHIRTALITEPRGHRDMYGCLLTKPIAEDSDFGIIFMHNSGFMSMCGHATIGVSTAIAEMGLVKISNPITRLVLESPVGRIEVRVRMKNGRAESVSFVNVPAFVEFLEEDLEVPGRGTIKVDVAYGGNSFVFFKAEDLNIKVCPENTNEIIDVSLMVMAAANNQFSISPPSLNNNKKINIATMIAPAKNPKADYLNVHVFSNRQYDRSPGGTATCARMAALHSKGQFNVGDEIWVESLTGGLFSGKMLGTTKVGDKPAIIPEITGSAFITGHHQFIFHPDDRMAKGFLF